LFLLEIPDIRRKRGKEKTGGISYLSRKKKQASCRILSRPPEEREGDLRSRFFQEEGTEKKKKINSPNAAQRKENLFWTILLLVIVWKGKKEREDMEVPCPSGWLGKKKRGTELVSQNLRTAGKGRGSGTS